MAGMPYDRDRKRKTARACPTGVSESNHCWNACAIASITGPAKASIAHGTAMATSTPTILILLVDFMDESRTVKVPDGARKATARFRTTRCRTCPNDRTWPAPPVMSPRWAPPESTSATVRDWPRADCNPTHAIIMVRCFADRKPPRLHAVPDGLARPRERCLAVAKRQRRAGEPSPPRSAAQSRAGRSPGPTAEVEPRLQAPAAQPSAPTAAASSAECPPAA